MSKKLTIGYVLDDTLDKSDGVQQAVIAIGEKMRSLGHDVHYIVPYTERTDLTNIHAVAKVIALKFNGNSIRTPIWSSGREIKRLFSEIPFDVLHVMMPYSPVMAARVIHTAPRNVRIVGTFHILPYNHLSKYGTRVLGWVLTRNKRRIMKAVAVSKPALEFMRQDFGLDGTVLANPVDYSFFHSFSKKHTKADNKKIVFVGRFEERKGVRQLLLAYEKMLQDTHAELIMCGRGPLLDEMKTYADKKSLPVSFKGFVSEEEKAQYLARADVAVFPSTGGESFGIVLTEAMAAGVKLTIGGNNAGYASVLEPWQEALFNPDDIHAFATKLTDALNFSDRYRAISKEQHEYVKQFDIESIAHILLTDIYV